MSEWLTTGEMIDRLKVGEVAECETGEKVKYFDGSIGWIDGDGSYLQFQLVKGNLNVKWRILPNYVSFEEAMKALKEGKRVTVLLYDGFKMTITSHEDMHDNEIACYSFNELFNAKWTIEE